MKNNLIKIKDAKELIEKNRIILKDYFEKKYPNVFKEDIQNLETKINKNLEILLCSSLKFKTTRIKIPRPSSSYDKELILSRTQCLTYPGRSSGKNLFETHAQPFLINKNWDLINTKTHWDEGKIEKVSVRFSVLKNNKLVDQKKLKLIIKLRKEAVLAQNKLKKFLKETYYDKSVKSECRISKGFSLDFLSQGLNFDFENEKETYSTKTHKNFQDLTSESLFFVFKYWNVINEKMAKVEIIKIENIKIYKQIIEELKNANCAFLVLQSLSKK